MRECVAQTLKLLLGLAILLTSSPISTYATEYSSTNFKVRDPDINIGGSRGTTSTNFGGAGTTGQSVTGSSNSSNFVVKAGFQYFDQTIPTVAANCNGNGVPICDGSTYGTETATSSSADTLSANWSSNGTALLFADPESGIYSYDYSIKRTSDNNYWSGSNWGVSQVRFNTTSLTATTTGLSLQAGLSYQFVIRAVNGGGLYTADFTSPGITVLSALTFTINPVASGQVIKSGISTNVSTSDGQTLSYGTLVRNSSSIAAHDLVISTNSSHGYYVTAKVDRQLTCDACTGSPTITGFPGTNNVPNAWGSNNGFGYTVNNRRNLSNLSLDPFDRFGLSDTWAAFTTSSTSSEVAYNSGPEIATTRIGYQIRVDNNQATGTYTNTIIYILTATY